MSRILALIAALALATLAGCVGSPPQEEPVPPTPDPDVLAYRAMRDWLDMVQTVEDMDTEQVVAELVTVGLPEDVQALFYFGLLNQKLDTYSNWTQARDAFREVSAAPGLTGEQQQLAVIMENYNQTRINWYLAYQDLKKDFAAVQQERDAAKQEIMSLKQKIQAITELETSISTRKEP